MGIVLNGRTLTVQHQFDMNIIRIRMKNKQSLYSKGVYKLLRFRGVTKVVCLLNKDFILM